MMNETDQRIPVHVITGFLGSGKTTLLNQLLKMEVFSDSAVIINEFGEVGLDHHLVEVGDDTIIELSNGCLCCTVRGQLIETIEAILKRNPKRIIIETTGLADPAPVLQALIATPDLVNHIRLGGLLSVFDVLQGAEMIKNNPEAARQIQLADRVILSKIDQIEKPRQAQTTADAKACIRAFNSHCQIATAQEFLASAVTMINAPNSNFTLQEEANHHHAHQHDVNRHSGQICSTLLTHNVPIERQKIDMFLDLLLSAHGRHILRIKGLVAISGSPKPLLVQGVGNILSEPIFLETWPHGKQQTQLVVFLDGLEPEFVQRLFAGFIGTPMIDTPDQQALSKNPLAVAGFSGKL